MLTEAKKTEALEALNTAQHILNDNDTDDDIKCCLGGLIEDVVDMETEN